MCASNLPSSNTCGAPPVKIAFSLLNYRPGKIGGTEIYLRQLLAHLPGVLGPDELVVLLGRDQAAAMPAGPLARLVVDASDGQLAAARILEAFTPYRARFAERIMAHSRCDVAVFPQQSIFPKRVAVPSLLVVHAVQHLLQPEQFALFDRAFRAAAYPRGLRRADRIVAISTVMKNTLVERCQVPAEKIAVIPHGRLELNPAAVRPTPRVTGRFLFYPAATYPYKGHAVLLETFARLRRGGYDGRLVLAGQQTAYWKTLARRIRTLGLQDAVRHLGWLPLAEVLEVYRAAEAVVLPTTYEGFGLPVMEAAAMEKKLIVSRLAIFDELGVPPAFQIDFADVAQLAAALVRPGPTRLTAPAWTWKQCAAALVDLARQTRATARAAARERVVS